MPWLPPVQRSLDGRLPARRRASHAWSRARGSASVAAAAPHLLPTAEKECEAAWHHLQHLLHKEAALAAAEKGKAPAEGGEAGAGADADADPSGGGGGGLALGAGQDDLNSCPICLDELSARTVTSCGHSYCQTCE